MQDLARRLVTFGDSVYRSTSDPQENTKSLFKDPNNVQMLWFHAKWCRHCVAMKDAWKKSAEMSDSRIEWHAIDCDDPFGSLCAREMKVAVFPTIIRFDCKEPYDGARTEDALLEFAKEGLASISAP